MYEGADISNEIYLIRKRKMNFTLMVLCPYTLPMHLVFKVSLSSQTDLEIGVL